MKKTTLRERLLGNETNQNIQPEGHRPPADILYQLVDYPHILKKVEVLWGTPELHDYLDRLFKDTRNDTRQGFPPPVNAILIYLINAHADYLKSIGMPVLKHEGSEFASRIKY